ncbi:3-oxoacyl-[acyl-carrier-protein] reductase 4-like protein isoform X1 [Tanacetum coccineum]
MMRGGGGGKIESVVLVNYSASSEKAEEVVKEIKDRGGQAIVFRADVSKQTEVANMMNKEWRSGEVGGAEGPADAAVLLEAG